LHFIDALNTFEGWHAVTAARPSHELEIAPPSMSFDLYLQGATDNIDYLNFLLDWAEKNISNPMVQPASCPSGPPPGKGPKT